MKIIKTSNGVYELTNEASKFVLVWSLTLNIIIVLGLLTGVLRFN